jgi:hypothetical protein
VNHYCIFLSINIQDIGFQRYGGLVLAVATITRSFMVSAFLTEINNNKVRSVMLNVNESHNKSLISVFTECH